MNRRELYFRLLRTASALWPEGRFKNRLRAFLLRFRTGLPRELMIGRGETVIQVGMWRRRNVRRLSRIVGAAGRVLLIEADRRVADELESFRRQEGLTNVTIVNRGAFNCRATRRMLVGESPSFNRIDGTGVVMLAEVGRQAFDSSEEIAVDTVDHIAAEHGVSAPDYVEITVNGLELEVLEGMERLLPRTRRLFMSGYARTREGGEPTNLRTRRFLRERGFRTTISRRRPPRQKYYHPEAAKEWGLMEGHVFAWRD